MPQDEWSQFLRLVHHSDHRKALAAQGDETWGNTQLIARAAKEYSLSKEDLGLAESLVGRVSTYQTVVSTQIASKS